MGGGASLRAVTHRLGGDPSAGRGMVGCGAKRRAFTHPTGDGTAQNNTVQNHKGLISCQVGGPTKWNPDDYVMITCWEDEASLAAFAGENWNQAVIPKEMQKYPKAFSVAHYNDNKPG